MEMEGDRIQGSPSYFSVLGVRSDSSIDEIRRAYRKLAMQWHPDGGTRTPSLLGEAKRKFQQIQEAYSVLSDQRKRRTYDAGLYDPDDEEDEGLGNFVQAMVSLMAESRREAKSYSMEDLQAMFMEMVQGFGSPRPLVSVDNARLSNNLDARRQHGSNLMPGLGEVRVRVQLYMYQT